MVAADEGLREMLRLDIESLILQEIRLLRLERSLTPPVLIEQATRSVQETKKGIIQSVRLMDDRERSALLKRMIREAVNREIDRAVRLRQNKCVRCLHGRFYDRSGAAHSRLPVETLTETVGCDRPRQSNRKGCKRFVEAPSAVPLEGYLREVTLLYEYRGMIDRIQEIWREYLTR